MTFDPCTSDLKPRFDVRGPDDAVFPSTAVLNLQPKNVSHISSPAQIERRMELVRVVSHNTHKRMVSCLQGHIGADAEKRHVRGKQFFS